ASAHLDEGREALRLAGCGRASELAGETLDLVGELDGLARTLGQPSRETLVTARALGRLPAQLAGRAGHHALQPAAQLDFDRAHRIHVLGRSLSAHAAWPPA